jgi:gliding motility-associated-like protein
MKSLLLILFWLPVFARAQIIYTVAGNGTAGYSGDGGFANTAQLNSPSDVCKDALGNIYIADNGNNRIRKIDSFGIISTVAGNGMRGYTGDLGPATSATLNGPNMVVADGAGNIYIADAGNNVIRRVNIFGKISTIVGTGIAGFSGDGGPATNAKLNDPTGVAVDLNGNIYVSDHENNRIRKINTEGIISTYAGGGSVGFTVDGVPATSISLCGQNYVSVDNAGTIYMTNYACWHFLKVTTSGLIYNVAGYTSPSYSGDCGPADSADIHYPFGICPDNLGNVYLCPQGNVRVRKVNSLNYISTVAGNGIAGYSGDGGQAINANVSTSIYGIYADVRGQVYFADSNVIRCIKTAVYMCSGSTDTLHSSTAIGTWSSSNTAVATVDSLLGIVTAISFGTAIITYSNTVCPATMLINVISIPTIVGKIGCPGTAFSISNSPVNYTWSSSNLSVASINAAGVVNCVSSGTSTITYSLPGCSATTVVTVNPIPEVSLAKDTFLCEGETLMLSSPQPAGNTYLWNTGDTTPTVIISKTGTYFLTVVITGCAQATDSVKIEFKFCGLHFPTAFTPNNDGRNDMARALGRLNLFKDYALRIYDRFGQQVFYTEDIYAGWDGTFKGVNCDIGTYFYVIIYGLEGKKYLLKGDLTLIR